MDAPIEVTQEGGHTGFLHLLSAVLSLIFIARKFQPSLSLVDRKESNSYTVYALIMLPV